MSSLETAYGNHLQHLMFVADRNQSFSCPVRGAQNFEEKAHVPNVEMKQFYHLLILLLHHARQVLHMLTPFYLKAKATQFVSFSCGKLSKHGMAYLRYKRYTVMMLSLMNACLFQCYMDRATLMSQQVDRT